MEFTKDTMTTLPAAPTEMVQLKVTAKPGLCLRKAPSTNATVLEVLGMGTVVLAAHDELGEAWVPVSTKDGKAGYVKAAFVKEAK
jgi:uncharacterized protein YgiM (DUF1202 family)